MKRVTEKTTTLRRARAEARVRAAAETIERMRRDDLPKTDVLVVARVAGVAAAKKTPDLIPYCHPIPVDAVEVTFEVGRETIDVAARVEAVWKTGVEMEALTAAAVAALTIYDMLKPVDDGVVVESIRLAEKRGGKSSYRDAVPEGFRAAVVVTSDGTHAGTREDRSGVVVCERLRAHGIEPDYRILPDDRDAIEALLRAYVAEGVDLVLTSGGTGLGPRDVTVEATRAVIDRELPGVAEAGRAYGQARTPYAMLSRGLAGVAGRTIIVNLPGSSRGAEETLAAVFPGILHAYAMLRGGGH